MGRLLTLDSELGLFLAMAGPQDGSGIGASSSELGESSVPITSLLGTESTS